jgi:hypothetical protein
LTDEFPIQNGLEQRDVLSPFLPNFALEYPIKKVQENEISLDLNDDDFNLLGHSVNTIKEIQKYN